MELKQTLYDKNYKLLLKSGGTLTNFIIEKLKNIGFTMIWVSFKRRKNKYKLPEAMEIIKDIS